MSCDHPEHNLTEFRALVESTYKQVQSLEEDALDGVVYQFIETITEHGEDIAVASLVRQMIVEAGGLEAAPLIATAAIYRIAKRRMELMK